MNHRALARHLIRAGASHQVELRGPGPEIRDTLVQLSPDGRRLFYTNASLPVRCPDAVHAVLARCPEALWVCEAEEAAREARLVPFAPPRVLTLQDALPLRVHESLLDRLEEYRLRLGGDLSVFGAVRVGSRRYAVLGQRTLATVEDRDALQLSWWLPRGGCLELTIAIEQDRGWLQLTSLVRQRDAAQAQCQPTALLRLAPGCAVPLVDDDTSGSAETLRAMRPQRSALFESWARYRVLERVERQDREKARVAHPLPFTDGGQHRERGRWSAVVRADTESLRAWLGADAREDRDSQLDQRVVLKDNEDGARFTLERARLTAPGLAAVTLKGERGARLPHSGVLVARENKGVQVAQDREEEALTRLMAGNAACEVLLPLLIDPSDASAPSPARVDPSLFDDPAPDPHQRRAIELILGCGSVVAIQGPPGTGKTRVIVEALRQLADRRRRGEPPLKVLIASVQNEAIANVVERLGRTEGVQVRWVRRRGQDEAEQLAFAEREQAAYRRVVDGLRERLKGNLVTEQLARIHQWLDELDRLRMALTGGADDAERIAEVLEGLAGDDEVPLNSLLRAEAREILRRLSAPPQAQAAPPPAAPPPETPTTPEQVAAWWERARGAWPVSEQATVGALVQTVAEAVEGAARTPLRYRRRLAKSWEELSRHLDQAQPTPAAAPTRREPALEDQLDAWLASAARALREVTSGIEHSQEAVALRFLQALEADPALWGSVLERHGDTVAATCSMSATAADPGERFDWVIIDEAGRASPFELLVPMVQGQRVVLIGDHRQLPPTVDDALVRRVGEAGEATRDIRYETLFGELYSLLPPGNRTRLAIQYRMHGDIGEVVDQVFYRPEKEPLTSHFSKERAAQRAPSWGVLGDRPLAWVDVAAPKPCSELNPYEARAVLELLRRFHAGDAEPGTVGVICGYRRQRDHLSKALSAHPELARVARIVTIDAVQGREYPAVIFCMVRSDGRSGFLASPNRVNVAISRAQRQLIIVGDAGRLGTARMRDAAPHIPRVLRMCRDAKACKPLGGF